MVNTRSSDAHKTRSMGPAPTVVDVKTPLSPKRTKSNGGVSGVRPLASPNTSLVATSISCDPLHPEIHIARCRLPVIPMAFKNRADTALLGTVAECCSFSQLRCGRSRCAKPSVRTEIIPFSANAIAFAPDQLQPSFVRMRAHARARARTCAFVRSCSDARLTSTPLFLGRLGAAATRDDTHPQGPQIQQ